MKLTKPSFPHARPPRRWSWRLGGVIGSLGATLGVLLTLAGIAALLGRAPWPDGPAGWPLLGAGLALLALGILVWRVCRQRLRIRTDLGLSPHLGRKRE